MRLGGRFFSRPLRDFFLSCVLNFFLSLLSVVLSSFLLSTCSSVCDSAFAGTAFSSAFAGRATVFIGPWPVGGHGGPSFLSSSAIAAGAFPKWRGRAKLVTACHRCSYPKNGFLGRRTQPRGHECALLCPWRRVSIGRRHSRPSRRQSKESL